MSKIKIKNFGLIKDVFSVGAGVSLAKTSDSSKTISKKNFVFSSFNVFLFHEQSQFLKERFKLDANPVPPFFAILAITKHSIERGFSINYKVPDKTVKLVTVNGVTKFRFFIGDSFVWYIIIDCKSPDSFNILASVLDICSNETETKSQWKNYNNQEIKYAA